jgi:choline-sulfatase
MNNRPNFLIFMVDQLSGTLFAEGPPEFLQAPNLRRLSEAAVNFSASYCASPLCVPARASFMSGRLPSTTGVYDNAAEFPASVPTFAHHLRRAGYDTVLTGKMHFVGPDQLHGFESRLTTDIYPADFGWTPDWSRPGERIDWWYHNMSSVVGAGVAETTNQLEFDDEVAFTARAELYRLARRHEHRPFCLTVSFTHPHDPYVCRQKYWDLYRGTNLPMPDIGAIPYAEQDPHSRRLLDACDASRFDISEQNVRDARRAYFANLSYLDEKVGEVLEVCRSCGLHRNTVIVFLSDHGDMLGERGLWFKMSGFEGSMRVPLLVHAPERFAARSITAPVSTLDLLPTLLDLASIDSSNFMDVLNGVSLAPLLEGEAAETDRRVAAEYAAEGAIAPLVMLRHGRFKLIRCEADPPQLFDLETDPSELKNLAADPSYFDQLSKLQSEIDARWDLERFDQEVRSSQRDRHLVYAALRSGNYQPWDHEPEQNAANRFMRNHMDLNKVEANARFPRERTRRSRSKDQRR